MKKTITRLLAVFAASTASSSAFSPIINVHPRCHVSCVKLFAENDFIDQQQDDKEVGFTVSRRTFWKQSAVTAALGANLLARGAIADDETNNNVVVANTIPMKDFVDPVGFFSIRVPKTFFTLRRSAKGDLPDAKTGQGRRGSSIFSAGDMAKAEIVAVERFPTRVLLEENGMEATGDLTTFPGLGKPEAVATLLNLRRERDKPTQSKTVLLPDSVSVSTDGKVLRFALKTEIEVQKPELLLEEYGVSQLFRITLAKASLESTDGNLMAVFASALEQDFNGPDGAALEETVSSFKVL